MTNEEKQYAKIAKVAFKAQIDYTRAVISERDLLRVLLNCEYQKTSSAAVDALIHERDALSKAAKMALETLNRWSDPTDVFIGKLDEEISESIKALRKELNK